LSIFLGIIEMRYSFSFRAIWIATDGKAKVAWFSDSEGNNLNLTPG